jgi:hypothetical protein
MADTENLALGFTGMLIKIHMHLFTTENLHIIRSGRKGVLNHLTDMDMQKDYVDTHGKSRVGFGICSLLHFDLLPRFKSIARQKLCYVSDADRKNGSDEAETCLLFIIFLKNLFAAFLLRLVLNIQSKV